MALKECDAQLNKDKLQVVKYIEKDSLITQDLEKKAEDQYEIRKEREMKIDDLDSSIQNLRSEIQKNRDICESLEGNREFIISISTPKWIEEQSQEQVKVIKKIKEEWVDSHIKATTLDLVDEAIIFGQDGVKFGMMQSYK